MDLSVIIPAYCEEENLRIILPQIRKTLQKSDISHEILIIDTIDPIDNTKAVCLENNATYINRENGNTYGDAIKTGIKKAGGKKIIFMDADGSHSPEFILELYKHKDEYDVVIASRYISGGNTENNKILIYMSKILNISYSLILGINLKDISNSFKLYDSSDLKSLNLVCSNFDIVEEIIFKLKKRKQNLKTLEIPFLFKKRLFGETKRNLVAFIITYVFTLLKLRFGKE